jgi:hypothetical protein
MKALQTAGALSQWWIANLYGSLPRTHRAKGRPMYYLYASKPGVPRKLAATFDTEEQLLAYASWATLQVNPDGTCKFEQGTPLVGFDRWERSATPRTDESPEAVVHNPTPSML